MPELTEPRQARDRVREPLTPAYLVRAQSLVSVRFLVPAGALCSVRRCVWCGPWFWAENPCSVRSRFGSVGAFGGAPCSIRVTTQGRPAAIGSAPRFLGSVPGSYVRFGLRLSTAIELWCGSMVRSRVTRWFGPPSPATSAVGRSVHPAWSELLSAGASHHRPPRRRQTSRVLLPTPGFTSARGSQLGACVRGTHEV